MYIFVCPTYIYIYIYAILLCMFANMGIIMYDPKIDCDKNECAHHIVASHIVKSNYLSQRANGIYEDISICEDGLLLRNTSTLDSIYSGMDIYIYINIHAMHHDQCELIFKSL